MECGKRERKKNEEEEECVSDAVRERSARAKGEE